MDGANNIYFNDIMTGLLASMSQRGIRTVRLNEPHFSQAMEKTLPTIEEEAQRRELNINFRIKTHRVYGDSSETRKGILSAMQRRLITIDAWGDPIMRIRISPEDTQAYLDNLPALIVRMAPYS